MNKFVFAILLPTFSWAQSYQLDLGDLNKTCDFVQKDEYSMTSLIQLIKSQLSTRLAGQEKCQAAFSSIDSSLTAMNNLLNTPINPDQANSIYSDVYQDYLTTVQEEIVNTTDPVALASLQVLRESLMTGLYANQFEGRVALSDAKNQTFATSRNQLLNYSSQALSSINNLPPDCVNALGGWDTIAPTVLQISGNISSMIGGPQGAVIGAGLDVAAKLVDALQNISLKKSINKITARQNEIALACSYQAIKSQACELKRAYKFRQNTSKIEELINNQYSSGSQSLYERHFIAIEKLPRINQIFKDIGKVGNAITLNVDLISQYFYALRVRPDSIEPVKNPEDENELALWVLDARNRGVEINTRNNQGQLATIKEQYANGLESIKQIKQTIASVTSILIKTRAFFILKDKLVEDYRFLRNELKFFDDYLTSTSSLKSFPPEYESVFRSTKEILVDLIAFVEIKPSDFKTYDEYLAALDKLGEHLFNEMARGSVAQITNNTVLLVPEIAFERFSRAFKAMETIYLMNDLSENQNPNHESFLSYFVNYSLQVKVKNLYPQLSSSSLTFRVEPFETAMKSYEKGFRKEIEKMVKNSIDSRSSILSELEGQTASHLCALFNDYLSRENPKLYNKCKNEFKKLPLLEILGKYQRPTEVAIKYEDPCFYNDYKREENGQRLLFLKLLDYGNSQIR
jgi:hypothetical protein